MRSEALSLRSYLFIIFHLFLLFRLIFDHCRRLVLQFYLSFCRRNSQIDRYIPFHLRFLLFSLSRQRSHCVVSPHCFEIRVCERDIHLLMHVCCLCLSFSVTCGTEDFYIGVYLARCRNPTRERSVSGNRNGRSRSVK